MRSDVLKYANVPVEDIQPDWYPFVRGKFDSIENTEAAFCALIFHGIFEGMGSLAVLKYDTFIFSKGMSEVLILQYFQEKYPELIINLNNGRYEGKRNIYPFAGEGEE